MVTNETMAIRTAKNVVSFLNNKGIKCSSDFVYAPVKKTLRPCWYVKKLVECGATDCIHINLECGGFIVITNDCKLMSGMNVMIQDAVYNIFYEYVDSECGFEPYDSLIGIDFKTYFDDWGDNGMLILEPNKFTDWVNTLKFYD